MARLILPTRRIMSWGPHGSTTSEEGKVKSEEINKRERERVLQMSDDTQAGDALGKRGLGV